MAEGSTLKKEDKILLQKRIDALELAKLGYTLEATSKVVNVSIIEMLKWSTPLTNSKDEKEMVGNRKRRLRKKAESKIRKLEDKLIEIDTEEKRKKLKNKFKDLSGNKLEKKINLEIEKEEEKINLEIEKEFENLRKNIKKITYPKKTYQVGEYKTFKDTYDKYYRRALIQAGEKLKSDSSISATMKLIDLGSTKHLKDHELEKRSGKRDSSSEKTKKAKIKETMSRIP